MINPKEAKDRVPQEELQSKYVDKLIETLNLEIYIEYSTTEQCARCLERELERTGYYPVERGLETDRVKFTAIKRYYDLNNLQNNNQETGMPLAEQITLDIDMADIRSQSIGQEFVTFSGVLSGMETGDSSDILALAAILNGRVYYSIFDKSDFTYRFTFQAKDIIPSSDISFLF